MKTQLCKFYGCSNSSSKLCTSNKKNPKQTKFTTKKELEKEHPPPPIEKINETSSWFFEKTKLTKR